MRQYKYKDQMYHSAYSVRQAIWKEENKIFPKEPTDDLEQFWSNLGVEYSEGQPEYTDDLLAERARIQRDRLLSDCDYYLIADYPSSVEGLVEVKAYRQALRDITNQEGFPKEISWPLIPTMLGGDQDE